MPSRFATTLLSLLVLGAPIPAFAEEGGPARIPGPLVRVSAGTEVQVVLRYSLLDTLLVHGLHARDTTGRVDATPLTLSRLARDISACLSRFPNDSPEPTSCASATGAGGSGGR